MLVICSLKRRYGTLLVRLGADSWEQLQPQQRQLAAQHWCPRYAPRADFECDRPLVPSAMLSSHHAYCASAAGADSAALQIKGGGGRPFCGRPAASCLRRPRAPTSSASMVDLWCALGPFPPPCIHPPDDLACSADLLYFALIARRYGRRRGEGGGRPCLHLGRTFCALRGGHGRPQADRSWFFQVDTGMLAHACTASSCTQHTRNALYACTAAAQLYPGLVLMP
jgi:hypothetical protein